MKEKRSINIEKETKQAGRERPLEAAKGDKEKVDNARIKQHPRQVGYHGTDDERRLSPEE